MTKKVLITGGAGFIAHHIIYRILTTTDWEIVSLDRLDYSGNLNRLADMMQDVDPSQRRRLRVVWHDLKAEINSMIAANIGQVDYILHLAAGSHVDRSIEYPMEFVMDNVVGTVNLLQFARTQKNLNRFVYFSTDEVFGPAPQGVSYSERDRYNSTNPYSASKAAAEEMCVAYHNTYNLPIYITHTMNIFGERQNPEKYVPMTIKKIFEGETLNIHFDSKTGLIGSRSYLHAEDVADAMLFLLNLKEVTFPENHMGGKCPKFNISSDEEFDNLEIAHMIGEHMGVHPKYVMSDPNIERPGHDMRYLICGDYMRELGWKKKRSVRESMKSVVEHTVKHLKEQNQN